MLYFLMPQAVGVGGIEIAPAKIKEAGGIKGGQLIGAGALGQLESDGRVA
jgi:hypothetical protein